MKVPATPFPELSEIYTARNRLQGLAIHSPLIKLNTQDAEREIYLKLENLQPIGVFKIRCIGNLLMSKTPQQLKAGVYTASSGNSGYAMAWMANRLGIPARVYAPPDAPESKRRQIQSAGAELISVPYRTWWEIIQQQDYPDDPGLYINAVGDPAALAGNATIGLEILEDLPNVETLVIPFGGGGVSCGIASSIAALKPDTQILGAECETATPLAAALESGHPVAVEHTESFISGIGSTQVLPYMWPLVRRCIKASVIVSLEAVAKAVHDLFTHQRIVAEDAGATALAAARKLVDSRITSGPVVAVITGGNIDRLHMLEILQGRVPDPRRIDTQGSS